MTWHPTHKPATRTALVITRDEWGHFGQRRRREVACALCGAGPYGDRRHRECLESPTVHQLRKDERLFTWRGRSLTISQWAREPEVQVSYPTLKKRFKRYIEARASRLDGEPMPSLETVLTAPRHVSGRKAPEPGPRVSARAS